MSNVTFFSANQTKALTFDFEKCRVESHCGLYLVSEVFWGAIDGPRDAMGNQAGSEKVIFIHEGTDWVTVDANERTIKHIFGDPDSFLILWEIERIGRCLKSGTKR